MQIEKLRYKDLKVGDFFTVNGRMYAKANIGHVDLSLGTLHEHNIDGCVVERTDAELHYMRVDAKDLKQGDTFVDSGMAHIKLAEGAYCFELGRVVGLPGKVLKIDFTIRSH